MKVCSVDGCENKCKAHGYCIKHLRQIQRHGRLTPELERESCNEKCKVDNCKEKAFSKGYCSKHYQEYKKYGNIDSSRKKEKNKICSIEGCNEKHYAKGYCSKHYQQYKYQKKEKEIIVCSIEDCNEKHYAKGYCSKHYSYVKKYGVPYNPNKIEKNKIIYEEDIIKIEIYNTRTNELQGVVIVDNEPDIKELIISKTWGIHKKYCFYKNEYDKKIKLHNLILPPEEGYIIDHIDRDTLNNRKCNLRQVTSMQNSWNSSTSSNNISGYKGVRWDNKSQNWIAFIQINGKTKTKSFKKKEEAIEQRYLWEYEHYGEYAPIHDDDIYKKIHNK